LIEFPIGGIDDGTVRLRLRADGDTPKVVEACRDPDIVRYTRVPENYDEATAREWAEESRRLMHAGSGIHLLIVDATTDELLGSIGIHEIDHDERRCEMGYWLARWARGRGAMTRAVRLLSSWAFESLPVDKITIHVQPENAPSRAVAERSGYEFEGVLRSHTIINGERRDMASYSLLSGDLREPE
jgi:RimJ/RimL family protein N-acetyltransferase